MQNALETGGAMKAFFHLPGLFEHYALYRVFLPLFFSHREYFYDFCEIGSLYGAPEGCLWGGGRVGCGLTRPEKVTALLQEYHLSGRLTFSNSLLQEKHLSDQTCNALCAMFENSGPVPNGVIVASDLLLSYLKAAYPGLYFVSSTTKVLTDFAELRKELDREDFAFVVPDFRLNKAFPQLASLSAAQKQKVEFLCNECCWFHCPERKACYENVSRKNLGESVPDHRCASPDAARGYRFSDAMRNPGFIGIDDIQHKYMPLGFSQFKIEGRGLGSAVILEFLLHYLTRPSCQLQVREALYLDSDLDLF